MRNRISISLAPDVLAQLQAAARAEHRSLSSMISVLIVGAIQQKNAQKKARGTTQVPRQAAARM